VMRLKESLEKASPASEMAESSIATSVVSVEPVDWPEVGQFDRLLQRSTEANSEEANAEAERSET